MAQELRGLPCDALPRGIFPHDRKWCGEAVKKLGLKQAAIRSNGGQALAVPFDVLPAETAIALLQRRAGIEPDDAPNSDLWTSFQAKPRHIQEDAAKSLDLMLTVHSELAAGVAIQAALERAAASSGLSFPTVRRMYDKVRQTPRADWLPALAKNYKGGGRKVDISEEAWRHCLSFLKESSGRMPLSTAYRKTAEAAQLFEWDWPSYGTIRNRWEALSAGEKALIKSGPRALDITIPPQSRSVAGLQAMQLVNLDGRQTDFFVRWEDGCTGRAIVIAIQDVYSRCVLGWRFAKTEDADTTKAVILDVIDRFGLFDELLTDNGRAFASKKISGGTKTRFRGKHLGDAEELGILTMIGTRVRFAKPRRGQSKPIERGFRDVAEQIDTLPEFKAAYCGHRPDAKPEDFSGLPVDVAVARAVYERELRAHNERTSRRTEMARGKLSFLQVFEESFRQRPRRNLTQAQRAYFMSDMAYLKPNKNTGALSKGGFTWWSPKYQDVLLKHRNEKVCVLFDPNDRSKPIVVRDGQGRMIVESLPCYKKGRFISTEDARQHHRGKAQIKAAAKASLRGWQLMTAADLANIQRKIDATRPDPTPPIVTTNVTKPLFGNPGPGAPKPLAPTVENIPKADQRAAVPSFDEALEALNASRRKKVAGGAG